MKIRICDDVEDMAEGWLAAVEAIAPLGSDVARMDNVEKEISNLSSRQTACEKKLNPADTNTEFDTFDVLVVDYDLIHLDKDKGRITGEDIARLARMFSTCGSIIVMNQFRGPQFDLGMRGHLDSFADINIDAQLLGQKSLWKRLEPQKGLFNPTTWLPMTDFLKSARSFAEEIAHRGLSAPLMPLVGLDANALAELSDAAFGFLDVQAEKADQLAGVTVSSFVQRSIDEKVHQLLMEQAPDVIFNFVAFRLMKWLDRAVLRPMNVLIDVPHLLDRLPFVIDKEKVDISDPKTWSRLALDPALGTHWEVLKPYVNTVASAVLGRMVFDWFRLKDDERIANLRDEYLRGDYIRYYLAEDTSRFVGKANLKRFRADFHNFGDRRGFEDLSPTITYGPLRRIHFGD